MKKSHALVTLTLALSAIASPAWAQSSVTAPKTESVKVLDLRPPDITKSPTLQRMASAQARTIPEKIEVIGSPELLPQTDSEKPRPWMGPAAVFWGFVHPLSAWRILAPLDPEIAQQSSGPPNLDYEVLRMSTK